MSRRAISTDNEVKGLHNGGGVGEGVASLIKIREHFDRHTIGQRIKFAQALPLLQAYQTETWYARER